jgi:zinc protease
VRATTPARLLEPTLELLADVARRPTFPDAEIQRLRDEQASEILQRRKEPRALASDMAARLFYGADTPYGHPLLGVEADVARLSREDVAGFHRATYTPRGAALMLVGDVDVNDATEAARRHFGDWTGPDASPVTLPAPKAFGDTTVFVVDRPDAVQSEIRVVQHGIERTHPDYFALQVMNSLLGGAFTSRLNLSLREKHGFTYGVRSGFAFRRMPGPFSISTAVGTEVTAPAVREIVREVDLLRESGAQEEEVERARDYLSGILPLEWQTTDQLAERLADIAIFGLPDDYFRNYRARIAAVTKDDVDRVAREYLDPTHQAIVVIGSAAAIADPLRALERGAVEIHRLED